MPGTPVALGPWSGGLNTVGEDSTIKDDELVIVENFEQDTDGSLKSRPAIITEETTAAKTGGMDLLGYYIDQAGVTYAVVAMTGATWLYNPSTKAWTQIWANKASGFCQYDNKAVLISETVAGGYWEKGTWTAMSTMPLGSQIVVYQERFWAFGAAGTTSATTVWFSNLTVISPASSIYNWTTTRDYFTVGLGDGESITALVADVNALLVFKNRSTWQFTYPSAPAQGTLRQVSSTTGSENKFTVVPYDNYYLVYCAGYLYQFINYRYYPLNRQKITFTRSTLASPRFDIRLSVFGQRAILWFYGALYVYNVTSSTWSTWASDTWAGQFLALPDSSLSGEARTALAVSGSPDATLQKLWRINEDLQPVGGGESFTCRMRTKAYSFEQAAQYKRLMYWTVEVNSSSGVDAIAHPVAIPQSGSTWNDMTLHTWGELDQGSWNNPLIDLPEYVDDVAFPTLAPVKALVKVTARFRALRMFFEVFMACDGTTKTAPARLYSITPYLKIHANVSSKVS